MRKTLFSGGYVKRLRLRGSLRQSSNGCVYMPNDFRRNRNEQRNRRTQYTTIIALMLMTCPAFAVSPSEKQQVDNFKASTLKGLHSAAVTVKIIRDNDKTLELLNEVVLQKEAEFVLRNAGIDITGPTPDAGLYVIIVKVAATGRDNMYFAMHVQSSLSQIVELARDPNIKTEAQTWPAIGQARFGVAPLTVAKSTVEKTVKDQAQNFVDDWKAANPKPSAAAGDSNNVK
jgi:hypothetical protein